MRGLSGANTKFRSALLRFSQADFLTPKTEFRNRCASRTKRACEETAEGKMARRATKEDIPKNGVVIDAAAPLERVVDEILEKCNSATDHVREGRS